MNDGDEDEVEKVHLFFMSNSKDVKNQTKRERRLDAEDGTRRQITHKRTTHNSAVVVTTMTEPMATFTRRHTYQKE